MNKWAAEEFGGAKLGDGRLTKRLIKVATDFAARPTASIPGACSGWVETQAAYRFFDQASEKKQGLVLRRAVIQTVWSKLFEAETEAKSHAGGGGR